MPKPNINIPRLFTISYNLFKKYASFIIGVMTTYFVLGMVPQVYMFIYAPAEPTAQSQITSIVVLLVQLFLSLGFIKVIYFLADDRAVDISDFVKNGGEYFSYVVAYFMYFFAVLIGLVLLVIPGIFLAIRLQFYPYFIIEHGDHSYQALQKSWYATEGWELELFLFGICMLALNFLGALLFGIGVIVTYPITTLATAIIFISLRDKSRHVPSATYLERHNPN